MAKQKYKVVVPPDELTEELAYWLGFLLADGNLIRDTSGGIHRSWRITIELKREDEEHLQKFLDYLKSDYPIYHRKNRNRQPYIAVRSEELGELLLDFGITPNKTLVACVDPRLSDNRHFWRGVVDGDGSIGKKKNRTSMISFMNLCGTRDVCIAFRNFVNRRCGALSNASVRKHGQSDHLFTIETNGSKAEAIIGLLYDFSNIGLSRKLELAGGV